MNPLLLRVCCVLVVVFGYILDVNTTWAFTGSILNATAIVLSAFAGSRRFTWSLAALAIIAEAIAGYVVRSQEGYNVAADVGNRVLSAINIVAVAFLSNRLQEASTRNRDLALLNCAWAEHETALRRAVEVMRSSMDPTEVDQAIVREAATVFEADVGVLIATLAEVTPTTFRFERGSASVSIGRRRLSPELLSLVRRAQAEAKPVSLDRADESAKDALDALGADHALAIQLADRGRPHAVLAIARTDGKPAFDAESRNAMWAFAVQASLAISQANLFAELVRNNERLANAQRAPRE